MRVLLVEDDPDAILVDSRIVHASVEFVELVVCTNSKDGHRAIVTQEWDLIILDFRLPGNISGVDLMRLARDRYPTTPVAIVSGLPSSVTATMSPQEALEVPVIGKDLFLPRKLAALIRHEQTVQPLAS